MNETTYTVTGMHCQSCVANVSESVSEVTGVSDVDVDLDSGRVVVKGEGVDDAAVRAAIVEAGYRAA